MEALLALIAIAWLASPLVQFGVMHVERRRRRKAEGELRERHEWLQSRVRDLERRLDEVEAWPSAPRATTAEAGPMAQGAWAEEAAVPEPLPTTPVEPVAGEPVPGAFTEPPDGAARSASSYAPPDPWGRPVEPEAAAVDAPAAPEPLPPPAPPPSEPRRRSLDLESLVGVRLFSWMAGITLLVAAVAFLRYSIEHGWLGPPIRLAIGLAVGAGLLVGCETERARRYRPTALALTAAGIATLFSTFFAAHALWDLLPAVPTFALMALVTAVAVTLSVRRGSPFIALLGLVGGFATPVLLATGWDRPIGLFSYLALLDVGLAWIAWRRRWPLLAAASLGLTALYQLGWVARFMEPANLPVAVGIFTVLPILGFGGLALGRRRSPLGEEERIFGWTAALGAVPPVLLAFHATASGAYADQWPLLFGFVLLVSAGLAAVAALQGPEWLHLLGGAGALAAAGGFLARASLPSAWPGLVALVALLVVLYLGAPLLLARLGRDFREDGKLGAWIAPLLLFAFAAAARRPEAADPALFFLPLLLLTAACAAFAVRRGAGPIHLVAAAAAVAAQAAWSWHHLSAERLLPALLAWAAFGLLFLGAPLLAERRRAMSADGTSGLLGHGALFGLAAHGFLFVTAGDARLAMPPWPWLAVLLLLDLAFLVAALHRREGRLLAGAAAGSTLILLRFASRLHEGAELAILAAVAVAGLGLAGPLLAARRGAEPRRLLPGAAIALFGAQAVLLVAAAPGGLALENLLPAHVALLLGLLTLAWRARAQGIALAASISTFAATAFALPEPGAELQFLALVTPLYLLLLAYPLVRGARARAERLPFVASIVASGAYFLLAHRAIVDHGGVMWIGLLPVAQAALLVPHLVRLLRMEAPRERDTGRLAGVAGAILALLTVAIPLQLEEQWITLGWALLAAALAWLHLRIPHRGLLAWCGALAAAVFVRLVLNPAVFDYQPRSAVPILNWYLYTYLVASAALFAAAALLARGDDRLLPSVDWAPRLSRVLPALAAVQLFLLVNIEIADWFSEGSRIVFRLSAGLASDLTYTIAWAIFALLLLAAGVALRAKAARGAAIALLAVTVLKGFLHDLSHLHGLYRVGSFAGLAVSLALVAVVLQRFVLRPAAEDGGEKA